MMEFQFLNLLWFPFLGPRRDAWKGVLAIVGHPHSINALGSIDNLEASP